MRTTLRLHSKYTRFNSQSELIILIEASQPLNENAVHYTASKSYV